MDVLRFANLEVDALKHRAVRAGVCIDWSAKEFALLVLFMRHSDEVLSKTQIASLVWDINFDSEMNVIEVAIRRLRAKIDDPFADKLIHTVRGVGYVQSSASEARQSVVSACVVDRSAGSAAGRGGPDVRLPDLRAGAGRTAPGRAHRQDAARAAGAC